MTPSPPIDVARAIVPLRLVFWGGLLCVIDIKINGFDIAHDLIGIVMIIWGVAVLAGIRVDRTYRKMMGFVRLIAVLAAVRALLMSVPGRTPEFASFCMTLVGLVSMIGMVVFCLAMRRLSDQANLRTAEKSWKVTSVLFIVIYLIPLGVFFAIAAICMITGQTFNFNLGGGFALLILPVFLAPLVHLFVSTSRMKREAEFKAFSNHDVSGPDLPDIKKLV